MFIKLNEWYNRGSWCGYQTRTVVMNPDEVSDMHETYDPYHNRDGTTINLKTGSTYYVKETLSEVEKKLAFAEAARGKG